MHVLRVTVPGVVTPPAVRLDFIYLLLDPRIRVPGSARSCVERYTGRFKEKLVPKKSFLLDYSINVITTITGKNQVTVPAEIAREKGMKPGTRLEWRVTDRPDVLEVVILPDAAVIAGTLRGFGNRFRKLPGSPVDRLVRKREEDEMERNP